MEAEQRALLQAWWTKSCHHLAAVRLLLAAEPPALDIAVYHCQQAAEKAIKTWLVWKEVPFPKTHDLNRLLGLCAPLEPAFENLRPHAAFLNPFAAEFFPRSQTPFGNAIAGETLFRWRDAGRGYARSLGNGVAQTSAFPNRVWERGNEGNLATRKEGSGEKHVRDIRRMLELSEAEIDRSVLDKELARRNLISAFRTITEQ